MNPAELEVVSRDVLSSFEACSRAFTKELASQDEITFLDLQLTFCNTGHMCWMYAPRTKKQLLPFESSSHSKLVKRGTASLCFSNALRKSCQHSMKQSFGEQVQHLKMAGFPDAVSKSVAETKLNKMRRESGRRVQARAFGDHKKVEVIPYIHKISHNIKKVAARHGVHVVFSAPCKLASLCPKIEKRKPKDANQRTKGVAFRME